MSVALEIRNATKSYGAHKVLDGVDLSVEAGQVAALLGPSGSGKSNPTRNAGKYSGAGATLQGLIAATTKKGDGLAKPLAAAINYLIQHGQYGQWLAAYNLSNEAVAASQVNPPGLPLTNS